MKKINIKDSDSIETVKVTLSCLVTFGIIDETSLNCYISYLNFKITGTLLHDVTTDQLGDEIIVAGRQYQIVQSNKN